VSAAEGDRGSGRGDPITVEDVRRLARGLRDRSEQIRSIGIERIARAVCDAVELLDDEQTGLGERLREQLRESTGLSTPMIEWGLRNAFDAVEQDVLLSLAATVRSTGTRRAVPARLAVCVLAGNVFTAGLRAMVLPLLTRAPLLARASSADDVLPRFLKSALDRVDESIGSGVEAITFDRDDRQLLQALFEQADVVSVYGSDATVDALRQAVPPRTRFVAHGHGLGAIYVPASCLSDEQRAAEAAREAALDVAAYDQRGCLSPHVICVQTSGNVDAAGFARLLADNGLRLLSVVLPRGLVPADAAAGQMQWRGVAAVRGRLFDGEDFAVSYEGRHELRPSPGYRNVGVYDCREAVQLAERLLPFGVHLKALGVAGDGTDRRQIAAALSTPLRPIISDVGQMQKPPFDAPADGRDAMYGLVGWIEDDTV
jgi:hypothetical protein